MALEEDKVQGALDTIAAMGRVLNASIRVVALVLAADRALIPDDVMRAAEDAAAVLTENAG